MLYDECERPRTFVIRHSSFRVQHLMSLPDPLLSQHRYIPNATEHVQEMLTTVGIDSVDRLFDTIPSDAKPNALLYLPGPWSEIESRRKFRALPPNNKTAADHPPSPGA